MPSILLTSDAFPPVIDGVANATLNYANYIQKNYGKAVVATPNVPGADDSGYDYRVIRCPSYDTSKQVGYYTGAPFSTGLQASVKNLEADLIHSHCPVIATMWARQLRQKLDAPVVMTYHTKFDIEIEKAVKGKLLQTNAKRLLIENISACDEVWVVSRGAEQNLRNMGFEGSCVLMENGVDVPKSRVDEAKITEVTGAYDLPAGVPVYLFVGRIMWYKGLRIILDALKRLKDGGSDFRMVFVGGGTDEAAVREYCTGLGLDDKVTFTGAIRDREAVRAWYCRANLFLFPSTFDTNGLVVREAAACSLASVLISNSCAAEGVRDGETGFLIEENAESLENCLKSIDIAKTAQVGINAAGELYLSWEDAVKRACERYDIVIENYRSGRYPKHRRFADNMFNDIGTIMALLDAFKNRAGSLGNFILKRTHP